jgi:HAD superfamily hydrolase (TIGR01509 family)
MSEGSGTDLRAIVFDMDGLLADTEPLSFRAWSAMIARDYGVTTTDEDEHWAAATVGKSGIVVWELIRDRFNLPVELPRDFQLLEQRNREIYNAILAEDVPPMPGAIALVHACKEAGLRLGVASSSSLPTIRTVLTALGLIDCFEALTSGKEVPRPKPDPAVYQLACARLGVEPHEAIALEDSGPGVTAARTAGLRCLAVPSEFTIQHDFSLASGIRGSLVGLTVEELATLPR